MLPILGQLVLTTGKFEVPTCREMAPFSTHLEFATCLSGVGLQCLASSDVVRNMTMASPLMSATRQAEQPHAKGSTVSNVHSILEHRLMRAVHKQAQAVKEIALTLKFTNQLLESLYAPEVGAEAAKVAEQLNRASAAYDALQQIIDQRPGVCKKSGHGHTTLPMV